MGPQDGVDLVAARPPTRSCTRWGRDDIAFTLMGAGDCFEDLVARARPSSACRTTWSSPGRVPDETVASVLSTADVGLCPDPKNPLNDVSTMNKTMEYMAFGLPVVAFDLSETRVSAADAAVYVEPNDVEAYARAIVDLLDDDGPRAPRWAVLGRERVERELAWTHQQRRVRRGLRRAHRPHRSPVGPRDPTSRCGGLTPCAEWQAATSSPTARSS